MNDNIIVIVAFVTIAIMAIVTGFITQWIVHRINPLKDNHQVKREGILNVFGRNSLAAFIILVIFNSFILLGLFGTVGALVLIASGPAMIIFGLSSFVHFLSGLEKNR